MHRRIVGVAFCLSAVLLVNASGATTNIRTCSGDPERFDDLVRAADVIAIVQAVDVGDNVISAPTVAPRSTPESSATFPPYPREDLSGIGATVEVVRPMFGAPEPRFDVDADRRAKIETEVRSREAAWPGTAFNCVATFMVPRYTAGETYLGLFRRTGGGLETIRLVRLNGDRLDDPGLGLSIESYDRYFADLPGSDVKRGTPEDPSPYAFLRELDFPVERLLRFIDETRAEPRLVTPPEVGSAGLRSGDAGPRARGVE